MKTVYLGKSGLKVSELGFGTMSFGGDADRATSTEMYARCRDAGINLFDCANVYAGGRSEEILGGLVSDHRDEVVIATKAYFPTGPGPNDRGSTRYHLVRAIEASLKRLQTDRVDLFFLHRMDENTPMEQTLRTLDDLVSSGKILYIAMSNFAAWQVSKALGICTLRGFAPVIAIQPMYNLLKRTAEIEILPMALSEGLGVLPYSPLGGGMLSGKYGSSRRPESGRVVDNKMYTTRYGAPALYEIAENFVSLARELGHHPVSLAIRWVASNPAVTAPLIGARSLEQLEPALKSTELDLSPEQLSQVSALSPVPPPATDRNEETSAHNYGSR
jgi:aryl-alcohol dehydrogenase-like predicted oxidoreductase